MWSYEYFYVGYFLSAPPHHPGLWPSRQWEWEDTDKERFLVRGKGFTRFYNPYSELFGNKFNLETCQNYVFRLENNVLNVFTILRLNCSKITSIFATRRYLRQFLRYGPRNVSKRCISPRKRRFTRFYNPHAKLFRCNYNICIRPLSTSISSSIRCWKRAKTTYIASKTTFYMFLQSLRLTVWK